MSTLQASLRIAFDSVLFPTDFTSASEAALPHAQALARNFASKIYVTHAVTPYPPVFLPMEPVPVELDSMWHDAEQSLDGSPQGGACSCVAPPLGDRLRGGLPLDLPSPDRPRLTERWCP